MSGLSDSQNVSNHKRVRSDPEDEASSSIIEKLVMPVRRRRRRNSPPTVKVEDDDEEVDLSGPNEGNVKVKKDGAGAARVVDPEAVEPGRAP